MFIQDHVKDLLPFIVVLLQCLMRRCPPLVILSGDTVVAVCDAKHAGCDFAAIVESDIHDTVCVSDP